MMRSFLWMTGFQFFKWQNFYLLQNITLYNIYYECYIINIFLVELEFILLYKCFSAYGWFPTFKVLFLSSVSKSTRLLYLPALFTFNERVAITASLPLLMWSTNHVLNSSRTYSTDAKPALFFSRVMYRRIMKFYQLHPRSTIAVIAGIYILRRGNRR